MVSSKEVFERYRKGDFQTCIELTTEIERNDTIVQDSEIAIIHFVESISHIYLGNYEQAQQAISKLRNLLKSNNSIVIKFIVYLAEAFVNANLGKYQIAEPLLEELQICLDQELLENFEYKRYLLGFLYNLWGNIVSIQDLETSTELHLKALEFRQMEDDKAGIAASLANIGNNYNNSNEFTKAIKNYEEAYQIFSQLGNQYTCAGLLNNIGIIYKKKGEIESALDYLEESLEFYMKFNNQTDLAMIYHNIGNIYHMFGDFENAQKYTIKGFEIRKEEQNPYNLTHSLFELSHILLSQDDIENPVLLQYFEEFRKLSENSDDDWITGRYKLIKAMWLKKQADLRSKVEAMDLLEDIIENNNLANHELKIQAEVNICDLLISNLKITPHTRTLHDVQHRIKLLEELAITHHQHTLVIEIKILEAKLSLLDNDLTNTFSSLDQAEELATHQKLGNLAEMVSQERENIKSTVEKWSKSLVDSMEEKIQDLEYHQPTFTLNHFMMSPNRLPILLVVKEMKSTTFTELKDLTGFSSTKLSKQLKKLIQNDYINFENRFIDTKPRKIYFLQPKIMTELDRHKDYIERYADLPYLLKQYIKFS